MTQPNQSLAKRMRYALAHVLLKSAGVAELMGFPRWIDYSFTEATFVRLVSEAYRANSAVFACVSTLAFGFIEPKLRVVMADEQGGLEPVANHPLTKLLRKPNALMSGTDLLQQLIIDMSIGGNHYWMKGRTAQKNPLTGRGYVGELIPLNDATINPHPGGKTLIDYYELTESEGAVVRKVPVEDIVHFRWMWDPLHPWRAMSPIVAAAREVDTESEAAQYVFNILKNDAIPRLAIIAPKDSTIDSDEAKRVRAEWKESQGGENRGTPAVLWGGTDIKTLSLNLQELAMDALRSIPEARICAALRVPAIVAGLKVGLDRSTFSNSEEAARWFTERTLVTLWRGVEEKITNDLLPEFEDVEETGNAAAFDLSTVIALAEQIAEKRTWVDNAVTGSYITVNEARTFLGLPADPSQDVYLRGLAVLEIEQDSGEPLNEPAPTDPNADPNKPPKAPAQAGLPPNRIRQGRADPLVRSKSDEDRLEIKRVSRRAEQARRARLAMVNAQRSIRNHVAGQMEKEIDDFFIRLAEKVIDRARKIWLPERDTKALPTVTTLLTPTDDADLAAIIQRYYTEVMRLSWGIYDATLGVSLAFDLTNPFVTEILGGASTRVRMISDTTRTAINTLLQIGNEAGWSVDELVRGDPANDIPGLRDIVSETYKNRARAIARTELGDAQNGAAIGRYVDAGITQVEVMDDGLDDDDPPCKVANGQTWTVTRANEQKLQHPNCLIGDALVLAPNVTAGYFRRFEGEVIVLRTAADQHLTCTPNHPILTNRGWVAAGKLVQGDQVVYALDGQGITRQLDPYHNQVPTRIEDMVRALRETHGGTAAIVPGTHVDFHGDGAESKVGVVNVDRLLMNDAYAALGQTVGYLPLHVRNEVGGRSLAREGALQQFGVSALHTTNRRMRRVSERGTLFERSLGLGERLGFTDSAHLETAQAERPAQTGTMYPNPLSQILGTLAGLVACVEVVKVERVPFCGHVYNLETQQGWYVANSIITHNCTRAFAPVIRF